MKKIHRKPTFFTFSRLPSILTALLLSGAGLVVFSACSLFASKQVFPDAYYNSNFIASLGFGLNETPNLTPPETPYPAMPPTYPSAATLPATAVWAFDYQYDTTWNSYNYMSLTDTLSQASDIDMSLAGATGTSPVYRLELVNLINRGDFETGPDGTWTGTGTATPENSSQMLETGNMKLDILATQTVTYTPTVSAAMVNGAIYYVSYRYNSGNEYKCESGGESTTEQASSPPTTKNSTSFTFKSDGSSPSFVFSPPTSLSSVSNLRVDNFRMTQKNSKMRLRLRLAPLDTTPALESGVYAFRVWVHTDTALPAHLDYSPYWLDTFSITMSALDKAELAADSEIYTASAGAGWVKLTATLSPHALQFHPEQMPQSDQVLELILDLNASQPGSVLLAQPELEFYPDGL